jgi:toxin secretion/phage lysis holin
MDGKGNRTLMNQYTLGKWATVAGIAVAAQWVKVPYTVQLLLMLMGLDVISGVIAAISTRTLASSMMVRGLFKKLAVFPLLALLHLVEKPLNLSFEFEGLAAVAFILYEAMSIIENCAKAGVPIPSVIVSVLAKAKIPTATAEEIHQQFDGADSSKMTVEKSSAVVKSENSSPDLHVDRTVTTIEENHVTPIPPKVS